MTADTIAGATPSGLERPTVLLTGFGPFPGVPINATEALVDDLARLAAARFAGWSFEPAVLPVAWEDGPAQARRLVEKLAPRIVLHFGVSEAAHGFILEQRAANTCRPAPDCSGCHPPADRLDALAPAHLPVSFPVGTIVARLRDLGLPAEVSDDAGGYLCNAVLFHTLREAPRSRMAGFVHVPAALAPQHAPLAAGARPDVTLSVNQARIGGLAIIAACLDHLSLEPADADRSPSPSRRR